MARCARSRSERARLVTRNAPGVAAERLPPRSGALCPGAAASRTAPRPRRPDRGRVQRVLGGLQRRTPRRPGNPRPSGPGRPQPQCPSPRPRGGGAGEAPAPVDQGGPSAAGRSQIPNSDSWGFRIEIPRRFRIRPPRFRSRPHRFRFGVVARFRLEIPGDSEFVPPDSELAIPNSAWLGAIPNSSFSQCPPPKGEGGGDPPWGTPPHRGVPPPGGVPSPGDIF